MRVSKTKKAALSLVTLTFIVLLFLHLTQDPEGDDFLDKTPIIRTRWLRHAVYILTGTLYTYGAPTEACHGANVVPGEYMFTLAPGYTLEYLKQRLSLHVDPDGATFKALSSLPGTWFLDVPEAEDEVWFAALRGSVGVDLIGCNRYIIGDELGWRVG